jgi:hypothetical protein
MQKENKEIKARRETIAKQIEEDYIARKKKYPKEIPKFAKATRINLDLSTYGQIFGAKTLITEEEMK